MEENNHNLDQHDKLDHDPTKLDINAGDIVNLPKSVFNFIKDIISIKGEIEVENTIVSIKQNMVFRGSAIWILICSIFVASVGLNFNSVAVIIGAMLISPLMGPIRGVGLALATNDFKTLISALKNFGVMILFSLATATLYFWLTPIKEDTSELLGRVKPQAFDILIAFFGGLAGIVASASNNKSAAMTIVPGVAIATALMPPLCTMSYGIATGHWIYAWGAFYLFLLNSVFICLSTVVLLRLLKFPKVDFVNPKTERKVKVIIFGALLLIVIPSIYKTYQIVKETIFEGNATAFIDNVVLAEDNFMYGTEMDYNDGEPIIKIYTNGTQVSDEIKSQWQAQLKSYVPDGKLEWKEKSVDHSHIESIAELKAKLSISQEQNYKLTSENLELTRKIDHFEDNKLNVAELGVRVKNMFPMVNEIFYGKGLSYNVNGQMDTVYTFSIEWKNALNVDSVATEAQKLKSMLMTELEIADSTSVGKSVKVIW